MKKFENFYNKQSLLTWNTSDNIWKFLILLKKFKFILNIQKLSFFNNFRHEVIV